MDVPARNRSKAWSNLVRVGRVLRIRAPPVPLGRILTSCSDHRFVLCAVCFAGDRGRPIWLVFAERERVLSSRLSQPEPRCAQQTSRLQPAVPGSRPVSVSRCVVSGLWHEFSEQVQGVESPLHRASAWGSGTAAGVGRGGYRRPFEPGHGGAEVAQNADIERRHRDRQVPLSRRAHWSRQRSSPKRAMMPWRLKAIRARSIAM